MHLRVGVYEKLESTAHKGRIQSRQTFIHSADRSAIASHVSRLTAHTGRRGGERAVTTARRGEKERVKRMLEAMLEANQEHQGKKQKAAKQQAGSK